MSGTTEIAFPRPVRATLRSFSLYDHAPEISAEFEDGVFCLAGANGLGKSTFLSAIGFAITGTVPDPSRGFTSTEEYLRDLRTYSRSAFTGRIRERDRELAEIELEMIVRDRKYTVVRNMFEPIGLRSLVIVGTGGEVAETGHLTDGDRQAMFEAAVVEDTGLDTFGQVVLLHHFVQTFDERRHLLFWDDKVSQAALFLAFGLSPDDAVRADKLRRDAERADSRARNHQYAATTARKRIRELTERIEDLESVPTSDEVVEALTSLQHRMDEAQAALNAANDAYTDATLARSSAASELRLARDDYEVEFSRVVFGRRDPAIHPVAVSILENRKCPVCGSDHESVAAHVEASLAAHQCPLCLAESAVEATGQSELSALDARIKALSDELTEADSAVARIISEIEDRQRELESAEADLKAAEQQYETTVEEASGEQDYDRLLASYASDIEDRTRKKAEARHERDKHRRELKELQKDLAKRYREAEDEFVPRFVELAEQFLGLGLDLNFEISGDVSRLVLSVDGDPRRGPGDLSESQRFFVDIALRMAIVLHVTRNTVPPVMYVDTPEGSLDIAYERRAGAMFGAFVQSGASMLMTANINTSELLRTLAETCRADKMSLQRMTEWATLSEVQEAEQDAFDRAFGEIEERLRGD